MIVALDATLSVFSETLARRGAVDDFFISIGYWLAGVRRIRPLPVGVGTRIGTEMSSGGRGRKEDTNNKGRPLAAEKASAMVEPAILAKCSDPQYCWLHGQPCSCCGGSDSACPDGTSAGAYWSYCCSGRRIFFRDCCGQRTCPAGCPFCNNSSQPNWCGGAGNDQYVCTLAEDHGAC